MSKVDVDNEMKVTLSDPNQQQETEDDQSLHQSPPAYDFIDPSAMQKPLKCQSKFAAIDQNDSGTQMILENNNTIGDRTLQTSIDHVRDFKGWSIYNLFCGCLLLGIAAFIMSQEIQERKRDGDLEGARKASQMVVGLNTISTVIGIIALIVFILRLTEVIQF